jgi:hypothetical protein
MAGCSQTPSPGRTFLEGSEALPGPGYFQVVGDPEEAPRDITVRNFGNDGIESGVSDSFKVGDRIYVEGTAFPGSRGLTVNGNPCDGRFSVVQDKVTEVVLKVTQDACSTAVKTIHDVDQ